MLQKHFEVAAPPFFLARSTGSGLARRVMITGHIRQIDLQKDAADLVRHAHSSPAVPLTGGLPRTSVRCYSCR